MSPTGTPMQERAEHAPVMYDPGLDGWADEPKVTDAERVLFGDYASTVRELGRAAVAAEAAYSLACKHSKDLIDVPSNIEEEVAFRRRIIDDAWTTSSQARDAYRRVAQEATGLVALYAKWYVEGHPHDVGKPGAPEGAVA